MVLYTALSLSQSVKTSFNSIPKLVFESCLDKNIAKREINKVWDKLELWLCPMHFSRQNLSTLQVSSQSFEH